MTAPVPIPASSGVGQADRDKLARAVAVAETSGCTDGTALKRNNCHGIMCWDKKGKRYPCYFPSQGSSFAEFKRIWFKPNGYYKGVVPDIALATKYSGSDHTDTWLCNVHRAYYGIKIPDCHGYLQNTFPDQYATYF